MRGGVLLWCPWWGARGLTKMQEQYPVDFELA